jgi:hypothetical protein
MSFRSSEGPPRPRSVGSAVAASLLFLGGFAGSLALVGLAQFAGWDFTSVVIAVASLVILPAVVLWLTGNRYGRGLAAGLGVSLIVIARFWLG